MRMQRKKRSPFQPPPLTISTLPQVVFRPLGAQPYHDLVEITCDDAPITVPLSAPLAASKLRAPEALDFGLVPARERVLRPLHISSVGEAPLAFAWRVEAPFAVVPASGRLGAGQGMTCQVAFAPEEAAAFTGSAACELDSGDVVVVKVRGWTDRRGVRQRVQGEAKSAGRVSRIRSESTCSRVVESAPAKTTWQDRHAWCLVSSRCAARQGSVAQACSAQYRLHTRRWDSTTSAGLLLHGGMPAPCFCGSDMPSATM